MVKAGLEPAPGATQNAVIVMRDGKPEKVPADVGVYLAVSQLASLVQQAVTLLSALHAHESAGIHPRNKAAQKCIVCRAESLTPEQVEEIQKQVEEQQAAYAEAAADIRQEEEEQVQE